MKKMLETIHARLTYHGHSCVELFGDERRVIIDPLLMDNPLATMFC